MIIDMIMGDSPWWAILVFSLLVGGSASFRQFRRFASVQPDPEGQTEQPVDPPPRQKMNWLKKTFLLIGGLVVSFFIAGMFAMAPAYPVSGDSLTPDQLQDLRDHDLLPTRDEHIILIYAAGGIRMSDRGCYFTNERIVTYQTVNSLTTTNSASYEEVSGMELILRDGFGEYSSLTILVKDLPSLRMDLPPTSFESKSAQMFHDRLKKEWESRVKAEAPSAEEATTDQP